MTRLHRGNLEHSTPPWSRVDLTLLLVYVYTIFPHNRRTHLSTRPKTTPSEQVTNTGNVDLTTITVSDPTVAHDCIVYAALGVGSVYTCSGSYSLTWPDIISEMKETTARWVERCTSAHCCTRSRLRSCGW